MKQINLERKEPPKFITLSPEAEWIMNTINTAQEKRTYGAITFIFEKGKVTRAKVEESIKAPKS